MKNNLEKKVSLNDLKKIEKLELKYLNKYYHFLKFAEDEMFEGFKTKEDIKDDWLGLYGTNEAKEISDFSVGAERIIYSLLNGKGIGQPNSSPVGSDLFFEVEDAYIHIDLKTVQEENIGDFTTSILWAKIKIVIKVRYFYQIMKKGFIYLHYLIFIQNQTEKQNYV